MACSLLECKKPVNAETGKVEVRAYQVTASQRADLKVDWTESGEGIFHPPCWNKLIQAAKKSSAGSEKSQSASGALQLNELETGLVLEAKKHAEYHDSDSEVKAEAARIAQMIKNAKYCIGFTGAGISTAAGIGDFRGKDGKWTDKDKLKDYGAKGLKKGASRGYSLVDLRPTYTHEAIVKLLEMGHIKYLISQNTDGLHRLSGIPEDKISELHGNAFVERCEKCEARYLRTGNCRSLAKTGNVPPKACDRCHISHRTGRICEKKGCGGYLMNTIINFGDYLESQVLGSAEKNAQQADLVLCLGSTLRVSPANALVEMGIQPIRLVICNRQGTPYDDHCNLTDDRGARLGSRVFGDCDKLMKEVMLALFDTDFVQEWEEERESRMKQYDKRRA